LCQEGKIRRPKHFCPCGLVRDQTLAHLREPCRSLSLFGHGPPLEEGPTRQVERKSLGSAERHGRHRPCLRGLDVPAELTELASKTHGIRVAKRVRQLLSQGECCTTAPQGLIRIAKTPQDQGRPRATHHALILSIERSRGAMLL